MYHLFFWMLIGTNAAPTITPFSSLDRCEQAGKALQQAYAPTADERTPVTDFTRFKCVKQ